MDVNIVSIQNSPTETALFVRPVSFQRGRVSTNIIYIKAKKIVRFSAKLPKITF